MPGFYKNVSDADFISEDFRGGFVKDFRIYCDL